MFGLSPFGLLAFVLATLAGMYIIAIYLSEEATSEVGPPMWWGEK